jgi:hypothetical protein
MLAEKEGESWLILEDDARFELVAINIFEPLLTHYQNTEVSNTFLYLGCYDHTNKKELPDMIETHIKNVFEVENAWHTHSYIITHAYSLLCLNATSEMRGSIDQHLVALQKVYPLHAIIPQVCHQAKPSISNPSTIKHTIQNVPLDISDLI